MTHKPTSVPLTLEQIIALLKDKSYDVICRPPR